MQPFEGNIESLQFPGAMDIPNSIPTCTDPNIMYPVGVVTTTSNTPQMYVLSMTVDEDDGDGLQQQEQIKKSIEILDADLNGHDANLDIRRIQEPQRTSTPTFDDNAITSLNDTILDGNLGQCTQKAASVSLLSTVGVTEQVQPNTTTEHKTEKEKPSMVGMTSKLLEQKNCENGKNYNVMAQEVIGGKEKEQELQNIDVPIGNKDAELKKGHTSKYCKAWVSNQNLVVNDETAQSDTCVEQDSCNSSLLDNVTSVSHSRVKETKFVSKKNKSQMVTKTVHKEKDTSM